MTHRERFIAAASHIKTDRAVFDLCGSPQTAVDCAETAAEIGRILGVSGEKQGDFNLDERILTRLDIDTRRIGGMPTPATVHRRVADDIYYDDWGIGRKIINGHGEICVNPLKDADIDTVMAYELPDADNIDMRLINTWAEQAKYLHDKTDYAVIAEHPVFGVFEIGCWMFGFEDYLYRLAAQPEIVHAFSARILEYQKMATEKYYGALGKHIDCTTSGDDFGTQAGPFMSAAMFTELVKPYMKERVLHTKLYTDAFFKHHTCGSVFDIIPALIDCGVDILNPIQPNVYMMEHERLKTAYGDKIAFWGGVDTQHLLPEGTVEDVKNEVMRILSVMDKNGGYILSPAHTIQSDVPARNVIAIYDGALDYYGGVK